MALLSSKITPLSVATVAQGALADNAIPSLADWTITQDGADLIMSYQGTVRFKLSSTGNLTVEGDVSGYGVL